MTENEVAVSEELAEEEHNRLLGLEPLPQKYQTDEEETLRLQEADDEEEVAEDPDPEPEQGNDWDNLAAEQRLVFLRAELEKVGYQAVQAQAPEPEPEPEYDEDDDDPIFVPDSLADDEYGSAIYREGAKAARAEMAGIRQEVAELRALAFEGQKATLTAQFESRFAGIMGEHKDAIMGEISKASGVELAQALQAENEAAVQTLLYAHIGKMATEGRAATEVKSQAPLAGGSRADVVSASSLSPEERTHLNAMREMTEAKGMAWTKELQTECIKRMKN